MIEGAASYGAVLAGAVIAAGYQVVEAARMDARAPTAASVSPTHSIPHGSPRPCSPWNKHNCVAHG